MRPSSSLLVCFSALHLVAGCSDDSSETPEPTPAGENEVRAVIGPDGGELVGEPGTELEGVKLVIPSGALASDVEVWLRPTFDGDALPELAERVGLQVEIGSDGALEKAATLTLPFDAGAVGRFGDSGEDVKVWVKGGDSWSLVEASDTSDDDVTIELDAFTTAAAGVKVTGVAPFCGVSCDPAADAHFDVSACSATSACVSEIAAPRVVETFDFSVSAAGALGFLTASGIMVIAVSHEIVSGTTVVSPELPPGTSIRTGTSFAGDTFFAGLGSAGNVAFAGTSKPKSFDLGAGLGVVTIADGTTLRLTRTSAGNLGVVNHASGKSLKLPAIPIPSNANIASIGIVSPRDPQSIMVIAVSHVIELQLQGDQLVETARIALPSSLVGKGSAKLTGADGIMVIAVLVGSTAAVSVDGEAFEALAPGFPVSSLAVAPDGRLLIGSAKSPELVLQAQSGVPTGIRLSDAATTDAAFTARIPRAIRATSDGFVVLTQDRNFLVVEPQ